ncbi:MAG TPA: response regulator [Flavisolibacter sp.]|nr:response regulator [Flavisolibacter sp.]
MVHVDRKHQRPINSIILADDDRDDHDFFKDALKEIAPLVNLSIVEDGEQLLDLLTHYVPDFIFLDLDMPGKNGLECLAALKTNPVLESIPIVIFSSTSRPANIDTAYELGADLFFIKPSSYNDLVSSIQAILLLDWSTPNSVKEQYFINGRYAAFM